MDILEEARKLLTVNTVSKTITIDEKKKDITFTAPSPGTYNQQWFWDSCLHSLVWLKLGEKDRAFEAIRDLFVRESQNKMFFVAVDDVQWIDKTSEEFMNYLIDWLPNAKVSLTLLYRPEYNHQWRSKYDYNHIGLDQLTMTSSDELLRAILPG